MPAGTRCTEKDRSVTKRLQKPIISTIGLSFFVCTVLCRCSTVEHSTVQYSKVLQFVVLCIVQYCTEQHCTVCSSVLQCGTVLTVTVKYCTALYCTVLQTAALSCAGVYCTALHCTALLQFFPQVMERHEDGELDSDQVILALTAPDCWGSTALHFLCKCPHSREAMQLAHRIINFYPRILYQRTKSHKEIPKGTERGPGSLVSQLPHCTVQYSTILHSFWHCRSVFQILYSLSLHCTVHLGKFCTSIDDIRVAVTFGKLIGQLSTISWLVSWRHSWKTCTVLYSTAGLCTVHTARLYRNIHGRLVVLYSTVL